ncbi:hypothetical protein LSH36_692g03046 [Paralvinella palmiformis]|uniref:Tetratricopeptide repeat protein n=1 Tax=Paralvinella palmiformis TaxID=53620 RepID=A0AAD9J2B5_9ANNE|nr:hypothetical protein LSH36_692g03046 [Paralvinella palmiformis]
MVADVFLSFTRKYEKALDHHRQALILQPENPATLSAMGYVHALVGHFHHAVNYFHKALGLRRDDTFSKAMLDYSLEWLMSEVTPCPGLSM